MTSGRERLADWLKRSNLTQRDLAKMLRLHWTTLNKFMLGRRVPKLAQAVLIEQVTGIAAESWLPPARAKRERAGSMAVRNLE